MKLINFAVVDKVKELSLKMNQMKIYISSSPIQANE